MRSLLVTLLFACGGTAPPPAAPITNTAPPPATPAPTPEPDPTSFAGIRVKMTKFTDDICACKDSACAQTVTDAMAKWGQEMTKANPQQPKMSEQETKDFTAIAERMGKCLQAAMATGSGATP